MRRIIVFITILVFIWGGSLYGQVRVIRQFPDSMQTQQAETQEDGNKAVSKNTNTAVQATKVETQKDGNKAISTNTNASIQATKIETQATADNQGLKISGIIATKVAAPFGKTIKRGFTMKVPVKTSTVEKPVMVEIDGIQIQKLVTLADYDGDGIPDYDEDGNVADYCPYSATAGELDKDPEKDCDGDYVLNKDDKCYGGDDRIDEDNDGIPNDCDNCPNVANNDQADEDGNGYGDLCEASTTNGGKATETVVPVNENVEVESSATSSADTNSVDADASASAQPAAGCGRVTVGSYGESSQNENLNSAESAGEYYDDYDYYEEDQYYDDENSESSVNEETSAQTSDDNSCPARDEGICDYVSEGSSEVACCENGALIFGCEALPDGSVACP